MHALSLTAHVPTQVLWLLIIILSITRKCSLADRRAIESRTPLHAVQLAMVRWTAGSNTVSNCLKLALEIFKKFAYVHPR